MSNSKDPRRSRRLFSEQQGERQPVDEGNGQVPPVPQVQENLDPPMHRLVLGEDEQRSETMEAPVPEQSLGNSHAEHYAHYQQFEQPPDILNTEESSRHLFSEQQGERQPVEESLVPPVRRLVLSEDEQRCETIGSSAEQDLQDHVTNDSDSDGDLLRSEGIFNFSKLRD